jgi:GT2 family glycosyltransferase
MDLSVIIITLNNKKILEECIDSVKRSTKSISYEIIVVDNNSTDGTQALIRSKHPDVKLIGNEKNLGFSAANNKGLKIAAGRYSLLLNDDTYVRDDAFGKIVKFMDGRSDIGICGPKLLNIDGSVQRQGSILSAYKWHSMTPVEVDFVLGACLFIRATALEKIGLLDENLFFYNDDLDLCKRARKASFKVVYFPGAQVYHYGGYGSKRTPGKKLFVEGFRGGLYFCKKHYGPAAYSLYRALLLLFSLAMIPFSLANKEKLNAYIEILKIIIHEQIVYKI